VSNGLRAVIAPQSDLTYAVNIVDRYGTRDMSLYGRPSARTRWGARRLARRLLRRVEMEELHMQQRSETVYP
jgi:hypothetical protein